MICMDCMSWLLSLYHALIFTVHVLVFVQSKSMYVPAGEVFIELGFRKLVRTSVQPLEESLSYFHWKKGWVCHGPIIHTRSLVHPTITITNIAIAIATATTARIVSPYITIDPIQHGTDGVITEMNIDVDRVMNMVMWETQTLPYHILLPYRPNDQSTGRRSLHCAPCRRSGVPAICKRVWMGGGRLPPSRWSHGLCSGS